MIRGFLLAILTACTFGLVPLFSVPLMESGIPPTSTLFLRFGLSAVLLMFVALAKKKKLLICPTDIFKFLGIGFCYALSAVTFLWAFEYMDTGIVATVQYCYPIFVLLIMIAFYGERFRLSTFFATIVICIGVAMFSLQDPSKVEVNFMGMSITIFSAVMMAFYVMGIQVFNFKVESQIITSLYILLGGAVWFAILSPYEGGIVVPAQSAQWLDMFFLTVITGVISTLSLVYAVKYIGPSLTSILGGVEPVTAMIVGVLVFGEPSTVLNVVGALCIIGAVTFVALMAHFRPR